MNATLECGKYDRGLSIYVAAILISKLLTSIYVVFSELK